jgi:hypothetical protein
LSNESVGGNDVSEPQIPSRVENGGSEDGHGFCTTTTTRKRDEECDREKMMTPQKWKKRDLQNIPTRS